MNKKCFFIKLLLLILFSLTSCEKEEKKVETLDGYSFGDVLSIDDEILRSFAKYGNRAPNDFYGLNNIQIYQIMDSSISVEDAKEKIRAKFNNAENDTNRKYTIVSAESIVENDLYRIVNIKYEELIGKKINYHDWNAISFNEEKCFLKSRYMHNLDEVEMKIFDFACAQKYIDMYEYMSFKNCKFIISQISEKREEYTYESISLNISYLDDSIKCAADLRHKTWCINSDSGVVELKATEHIRTIEFEPIA